MSVGIPSRQRFHVLGVPVDALDLDIAVRRIAAMIGRYAPDRPAAYICVRDGNGVMECQRNPELLEIHRRAAMVMPDGMALVWLGHPARYCGVTRVYGPDLMSEACRLSITRGWGTSCMVASRVWPSGLSRRWHPTIELNYGYPHVVGRQSD